MNEHDDRIPCEEARENARSRVRRWVTILAATYVFGGPLALMVLSLVPSIKGDALANAQTAYMLSAGLAGMVVGWWFAKRDEERARGAKTDEDHT